MALFVYEGVVKKTALPVCVRVCVCVRECVFWTARAWECGEGFLWYF